MVNDCEEWKTKTYNLSNRLCIRYHGENAVFLSVLAIMFRPSGSKCLCIGEEKNPQLKTVTQNYITQ